MNETPQDKPRSFVISQSFTRQDSSPEACPICHSSVNSRKICDLVEGQSFSSLAGVFGRDERGLRLKFLPPEPPAYEQPSLFSDPNHARYLEVLVYLALFVGALIEWRTEPPVFIFAGILAVSVIGLRVNGIRKQLDKLAKAEYEKRVSIWKLEYECWRNTLYCYRDDVIFFPGYNLSLKPENLKALLANHAFKNSEQYAFRN